MIKYIKTIIISIVIVILFSGCVDTGDKTQPTPTITPINEREQKVVDLAKEHLADTLSAPIDDIVLSNIEEVVWPDSSLGYPEIGMSYLPVETPGYRIFLSYNGNIYEYHSDYERIVPPPSGNK